MDCLEEWRYWEHVVLHNLAVFAYEVQNLGLGTTCAVNHTVNLWAKLIQELLDYWGIGTGRSEYQLAGVDRRTLNLIGQLILAAVNQLVWHCVVVALRIVLCEILGEYIVAGRSKSVATHTAVVLLLVCSLTCRRKTYDYIAWTDVGIVDNIAALHAAGYGRVNDDGTNQVAYISSLTAGRIDADTHFAHLVEQVIGTVDDSRDYLARDEHLVAADGRADEDVIYGTHAEQVVGIHHDSILSDTLPYREVASLLPVHVCQARLGTCTVGVHNVAILWVTSQDIRDNLAESLWEDTLVDVLDSVVNIFLCCANTAHHISIVTHILTLNFDL